MLKNNNSDCTGNTNTILGWSLWFTVRCEQSVKSTLHSKDSSTILQHVLCKRHQYMSLFNEMCRSDNKRLIYEKWTEAIFGFGPIAFISVWLLIQERCPVLIKHNANLFSIRSTSQTRKSHIRLPRKVTLYRPDRLVSQSHKTADTRS